MQHPPPWDNSQGPSGGGGSSLWMSLCVCRMCAVGSLSPPLPSPNPSPSCFEPNLPLWFSQKGSLCLDNQAGFHDIIGLAIHVVWVSRPGRWQHLLSALETTNRGERRRGGGHVKAKFVIEPHQRDPSLPRVRR